MGLMGSGIAPGGTGPSTTSAQPVNKGVRVPLLANRSFHVFAIALAGIAAISTLMGVGALDTSVGAPILSGIILGGAGVATNPPSNP